MPRRPLSCTKPDARAAVSTHRARAVWRHAQQRPYSCTTSTNRGRGRQPTTPLLLLLRSTRALHAQRRAEPRAHTTQAWAQGVGCQCAGEVCLQHGGVQRRQGCQCGLLLGRAGQPTVATTGQLLLQKSLSGRESKEGWMHEEEGGGRRAHRCGSAYRVSVSAQHSQFNSATSRQPFATTSSQQHFYTHTPAAGPGC